MKIHESICMSNYFCAKSSFLKSDHIKKKVSAFPDIYDQKI